MTATQVFVRFCKEYNLVNYYMPRVLLVYNSICNSYSDKSIGKARGRKYMLDVILKRKKLSLSDTLRVLEAPNYYHSRSFNNFLREKVKGNYYKRLIPDEERTTDCYGYRNGYHLLDFSYKETAVW